VILSFCTSANKKSLLAVVTKNIITLNTVITKNRKTIMNKLILAALLASTLAACGSDNSDEGPVVDVIPPIDVVVDVPVTPEPEVVVPTPTPVPVTPTPTPKPTPKPAPKECDELTLGGPAVNC
jgi:outer membrane biosynthesis protein TonB